MTETIISPVFNYVRQQSARRFSAYWIFRKLGQSSGHHIDNLIHFTKSKVEACHKDGTSARVTMAWNFRYNFVRPYARWLKNRSPKTSFAILAYDNTLGLKPFYMLFGCQEGYEAFIHNIDKGVGKAALIGSTTALANAGIAFLLLQPLRIPMRTLHLACLGPNVLKFNINQLDNKKWTDRCILFIAQRYLPIKKEDNIPDNSITIKTRFAINWKAMKRAYRRDRHKKSLRRQFYLATHGLP